MTDTGTEILRGLRRLTIATVLVYVVLAAAIVLVWRDASAKRDELARVTSSTNHALCVLRGDLEQRVAQSEKFLVEHPHGIAGIPASSIRQGIDNQARTVAALSSLECPAPS